MRLYDDRGMFRFDEAARAIVSSVVPRTYLLEADPDHAGFFMVRGVPQFCTNRRGATDGDGFDRPYLERIVQHHSTVLEPSSHFVPVFDEHHPEGRFDESRPKIGDLRNLSLGEVQVAHPETHELATLPCIYGDYRRIKPEYAAKMLKGDYEHRSVEIFPGQPRFSGVSLSSTIPPYFKLPNMMVELAEGVEAPAAHALQMRERPVAGKQCHAPVVVCFSERFAPKLAPGVKVEPKQFGGSDSDVAEFVAALDRVLVASGYPPAKLPASPSLADVDGEIAFLVGVNSPRLQNAIDVARALRSTVVKRNAARYTERGANGGQPTRFAADEVECVDEATGQVLWSGTFADLLANNQGDGEVESAINALRAAGAAEVTIGGGATPRTIIRVPRGMEDGNVRLRDRNKSPARFSGDPLADYAARWGRDPSNNFAVACYEMNSISELESAGYPDQSDMAEWGISATEWRDAIAAALAAKRLGYRQGKNKNPAKFSNGTGSIKAALVAAGPIAFGAEGPDAVAAQWESRKFSAADVSAWHRARVYLPAAAFAMKTAGLTPANAARPDPDHAGLTVGEAVATGRRPVEKIKPMAAAAYGSGFRAPGQPIRFGYFTTIRDVWAAFVDLHGGDQPLWTMDQLQRAIILRGWRYENIDSSMLSDLADQQLEQPNFRAPGKPTRFAASEVAERFGGGNALRALPENFAERNAPTRFEDAPPEKKDEQKTDAEPAKDVAAIGEKVDALASKIDALIGALTAEEDGEPNNDEGNGAEAGSPPDKKKGDAIQSSEAAALRSQIAELKGQVAARESRERLAAVAQKFRDGRFIVRDADLPELFADVLHDQKLTDLRFATLAKSMLRAPSATGGSNGSHAPPPESGDDALLAPFRDHPDRFSAARELLDGFRSDPKLRAMYRGDPARFLTYTMKSLARSNGATHT